SDVSPNASPGTSPDVAREFLNQKYPDLLPGDPVVIIDPKPSNQSLELKGEPALYMGPWETNVVGVLVKRVIGQGLEWKAVRLHPQRVRPAPSSHYTRIMDLLIKPPTTATTHAPRPPSAFEYTDGSHAGVEGSAVLPHAVKPEERDEAGGGRSGVRGSTDGGRRST
ncbi:MAG: hypothetical protein AAF235_07285, partial [Planctomycetota bacterium]